MSNDDSPDSMPPSDVPSAAADDRPLPPVEAPTGAFIMQLFLIPLVIVAIIVSTWLLVGWLAHADADPHRLAEDIRRQGSGSWQKAYTLSNMLHSRQYEGLKRDRELCQTLIEALKDALKTKAKRKQDIDYRVFLCRALGEFHLIDPVGVLVRVARGEPDGDAGLRVAAVQGLSVISDQLGGEVMQRRSDVVPTLLAITQEPPEGKDSTGTHELHATAAFALGVIGGPEATARLVELLDAAYPNTRYNAATGLAWLGDERALPILLEMLDPENPALLQGELTGSQQSSSLTEDQVRQSRQLLVISSAIRAVTRLCRSESSVDRKEVRRALKKITGSKVPSSLRLEASEALIVLDKSS